MSNLIITTAVGYRPADIWTFLASAARHCPSAEIIAIVHQRDLPALRPCCEAFPALTLYAIKTPLRPLQHAQGVTYKIRRVMARWRSSLLARLHHWGWSTQLADEQPSFLGLSTQKMFILNRRFFLARRIIQSSSPSVSSVLLSDSRDVVFQSDPFVSLGSGCHTGMEYRTHSDSPINAQWLRSTYGESGYNELHECPVLCSGVTIGSRRCILNYLDLFCSEIASVVSACHSVLIPIWDQAYHNRILRRAPLAEMVMMPWSSDLATVGEVPSEYLHLDSAGLVRVAGVVPSILHQYDRHPAIASAISSSYAMPMALR